MIKPGQKEKKCNLNRIITGLVGLILVISTILFFYVRNSLSDNLTYMEIENMLNISDECESLLFDSDIYLSPDTAYFVKLKNIFYYGFIPLGASQADGFRRDDLLRAVSNIQGNMTKSLKYNSNIHSVYVIINDKAAPYAIMNGRPVEIDSLKDQDWYEDCFQMTFDTNLRRRQIETSYLNSVDVITVYRKVVSTNWKNGKKVTGYIVVNYYEKHIFNQIIAALGQDESIIIYDDRGKRFASIGEHTMDDTAIKNAIDKLYGEDNIYYDVLGKSTDKQIYMIKESANHLLYFVVIKDAIMLNELISKMNIIYPVMLGVCLMIVLIFRMVNFYQYRRYVEGIVQVIQAIEYEDEEQDISLLASHVRQGGMDFQLIANKILSYSMGISELRSALYTEHTLRSEVEMLYGHAQINSHFLLNTLDTIYWKTLKKHGVDSNEASMIEKLCMILKYALDTPNPYTSLEEEILCAKYYLDIQLIRKEIDLEVHWNISQDLLNAQVGKLTFQPILENAIQHGMTGNKKIALEIKAQVEGDMLYIYVDDDGRGMSQAKMAQMNERLRRNTPVKSRHIGLLNINRRIQVQYGEQYGLKLQKSDKGGLRVRMKLKYIEDGEA